jgi:hypothetical protein
VLYIIRNKTPWTPLHKAPLRAEHTGGACLLTSGLWYGEQVYEKTSTLFPGTVLEAPSSHRPSGGYRVGRGYVVLVPEPPGCRFLPHDPRHPGGFTGHHQRHRHRGTRGSGGCGGPGGRQDRGLWQRQGRQDRGLRLRRGGRHSPGPDRRCPVRRRYGQRQGATGTE